MNGVANVRSAIYEEAWKVFKQHNIEIPFPQRDPNVNMAQMSQLIGMIKDERISSLRPE